MTAVRDLQTRRGSSRPHTLECDDGRVYLVKFSAGSRTEVNEYVGHRLANYLGLPVPPSELVFVPRSVIDASDRLRMQGVQPGLHQGTLMLEGCVNFRNIRAPSLSIDNAHLLPGLVVLDNFVVNPDRNNTDNNLLVINPSGLLEYRGIDFDEILAGPKWTVGTLGLIKGSLSMVPVFRFIALSVRSVGSFSPWLEKVESIPEAFLQEMLSGAPEEWQVKENEKAAIADFLLTRRTLVRGILLANRSRFPNWVGDGEDAEPRA